MMFIDDILCASVSDYTGYVNKIAPKRYEVQKNFYSITKANVLEEPEVLW